MEPLPVSPPNVECHLGSRLRVLPDQGSKYHSLRPLRFPPTNPRRTPKPARAATLRDASSAPTGCLSANKNLRPRPASQWCECVESVTRTRLLHHAKYSRKSC